MDLYGCVLCCCCREEIRERHKTSNDAVSLKLNSKCWKCFSEFVLSTSNPFPPCSFRLCYTAAHLTNSQQIHFLRLCLQLSTQLRIPLDDVKRVSATLCSDPRHRQHQVVCIVGAAALGDSKRPTSTSGAAVLEDSNHPRSTSTSISAPTATMQEDKSTSTSATGGGRMEVEPEASAAVQAAVATAATKATSSSGSGAVTVHLRRPQENDVLIINPAFRHPNLVSDSCRVVTGQGTSITNIPPSQGTLITNIPPSLPTSYAVRANSWP